MKSRFLTPIIRKKNQSRFGRILILTGARQTGKTTMAKHCFPNHKYISVEDPLLRMEYKELTASQWNQLYPKAVIDEIQKEPRLFESIKAVYDQFPDPQYVLLGSSQLLLMQKVKESLAGRCLIFEVLPLTLPEMLTVKWEDKINFSFFQNYLMSGKMSEVLPSFILYDDYAVREEIFRYYLKFGGYPAIIDKKITDEERLEWLSGYIRTYLERDIRDLADFKSLDPFIKVQRLSSLLTGQLINFSSLAKESSVSSKTAQRFIQYLELSYQVIMLQPWHQNQLKRLVKTPKLHYLDPGIQRTIIKNSGDLSGNEFESAIIAEIYKQTKVLQQNVSFFHLRNTDGLEVDLLIETESGFIAFEIKMSNNINQSDARHLKHISEILDKPVLKSFILSNDPKIKEFENNITAMPAALFLT